MTEGPAAADVLRRLRPAGEIVGLTDLDAHGDRVAGTAQIPATVGHDPVRHVAVVAADGNVVLGAPGSHGPRWSPDGERLAWIVADDTGSRVELSAGPSPSPERSRRVDGVLETVRWSPDGMRLLLVVAEAGAQLSDVVGSGTVRETAAVDEAWRPVVSDGRPTSGWRRAWRWDPGSDTLDRVSPPGCNVWAAEWRGNDRVVLLASDAPTESDWYGARLVDLDPATGELRVLAVPAGQLARPSTDPSGAHVAVVVGPMSDRGIDVGRLVVDGREIDIGEVDVTDVVWTGPDHLVFAGLRGLTTVVGRHRLEPGSTTVVWESTDTCGAYGPEVAAQGDRVVAWVHAYGRPPALTELAPAGERVVRAPTVTPVLPGRAEHLRWRGSDGVEVDGVLVTPDGPGPFPLVVHVHGGPVWAWRDEWSMHHPLTPLLVGHGVAVLHPNPRGSSGRGPGFARDGLTDLGGRDAGDIVAGVDAVVATGRVDPFRIGVTGNSYGGFMAAWLAATTDRFAAVVARSPVTEWVSQHLTSNLPAFDELCLTGPVLDPDSDYRTRSPLRYADGVRAEVMLMAGAHDLATPPEQAVMFHRALVERDHPSTLVLYPGEGHGVRSHDALVDQCDRVVAFFGRTLGVR